MGRGGLRRLAGGWRRAHARRTVTAAASAFLAVFAVGMMPAAAEYAGGMRIASLTPVSLTDSTNEPLGPEITVRVDISDQTMHVYVSQNLTYVFKVSTGRGGYGTPVGRYKAQWLSPKHRSRKYDWAPMPWSVFFHGGYAIHGTTDLKRLGRPASHGCVRLHPDNAKLLYSLVRKSGKDTTLITIVR